MSTRKSSRTCDGRTERRCQHIASHHVVGRLTYMMLRSKALRHSQWLLMDVVRTTLRAGSCRARQWFVMTVMCSGRRLPSCVVRVRSTLHTFRLTISSVWWSSARGRMMAFRWVVHTPATDAAAAAAAAVACHNPLHVQTTTSTFSLVPI